MKKLLISALALASLVACSKEEVVDQKLNGSEIGFEQAFVDNSTRAAEDPSTTNATLKAFDVWGFMDNTNGYVFQQQRVTGVYGGNWTYSPAQYWLPGHMYYFGALAPVTNNNWTLDTENANVHGVGEVSFTNVNGTEDLLYAAAAVSTLDKTVNSAYDKVAFTFNHLLSKVKFSFTNGFAASNYTITVKNIKMEVPAKGKIALNQADWWSTNQWQLVGGSTTLEFGNMDTERLQATKKAECAYERLTIPAGADQKYVVTFDVELYVGNALAHSKTLSTVISGAALEIGQAYNFHATLDQTNVAGDALMPIEFTVTKVKDWVDGNGHEGGVIDTEVVSVADATELEAAVRAGAPAIRLVKNIETDQHFVYQPVTKATVNEYVLDLNGYTLKGGKQDSPQMTGEDIAAIVVKGGAKLTVNGKGSIEGTEYGIYVKDGVANINGGNIVAGTSAVQVYNGTANIYGGNFSAKNSDVYVINCIDASWTSGAAKVNIYGGTFENFNPANNASEGANTNYVVNGYEAVANGNNYVVVPTLVEKTAATADELVAAFNAGANVTLTADITISNTLVVEAGRTVVLNLNGKTLNNKVTNVNTDVIVVKEGGNLTVNGNGTVEAVTGNDGYTIISEGVLTINGGTFISGVDADNAPNAVIYARGNGEVYVKGGKFPNEDLSKFVLNKKDADRATTVISVTGGQFWNFNPSDNVAEGTHTNFCANGYKAAKQGDGSWKVVRKEN